MKFVSISDSPIHGMGVFAAAVFWPGETILRIDDSRIVTDTVPLDPTNGELEHHCDYLAGGKVVLMLPPERFINHSCDANTYIRTIAGDRYVVALREIRPGDEITYDYCVNGDGDTEWICQCGNATCRKRQLSGFFHLPEEVQIRYLALLDDWFVREHRAEVESLKRRAELRRAAGAFPRGSLSLSDEQPIQADISRLPGFVLKVNPPVSEEELAALHEAAWGEGATECRRGLDHCLAYVCAYRDGRLVGFIKLAWDGGIHAFVLDPTVHPDHQRQGIGRQLIDRVVEISKRAGIWWLHVDYEPALESFYARCGFRGTPAGLIHLATNHAD